MSQHSEEAEPVPASPGEGSGEGARMVRADLVTAIVLFVLAAAILYGSWTMPRLEVRRIHPATIPGLVPGLLSVALMICSGLLGLRSLRAGAGTAGWRLLGQALVSDAARRALVVVGLVLAYTLGLVGRIPFWAATASFVFAFVMIFEAWLHTRPVRWAASLAWATGLAVATAVAVTLVFERLFLVRLP